MRLLQSLNSLTKNRLKFLNDDEIRWQENERECVEELFSRQSICVVCRRGGITYGGGIGDVRVHASYDIVLLVSL